MGRQQTSSLPYSLGSMSSLCASARSIRKGSVSWSIFTLRHGAAGGLHAPGSLLGSAVCEGSHDGELPSHRMVVLAGQEAQMPPARGTGAMGYVEKAMWDS